MADQSLAKLVTKGIKNPRMVKRYLQREYPLGRELGVALSSRGLLGTHVFERDWDVLILLDTCRVDALRMVAEEYPFLKRKTIDRICSVGGSSPEWMSATFTEEWTDELQDTAYLACNGFADFVFEAGGDGEKFIGPSPDEYFLKQPWKLAQKSDLGRLEHIWKYERKGEASPVGHRAGATPPRYVTDRAIAVGRDYDFDRLILHYNQPHKPYAANALAEGRDLYEYESNPWGYLKNGGGREVVFGAYLDELRYALDDVKMLLANIDAETVAISADHGEAFGEYGTYGHDPGSLHPHVRWVPWIETSGSDRGDYEPQFEPESTSERNVDETLRALGYR